MTSKGDVMFQTKPKNYGRDCILSFLQTSWINAPQAKPQEDLAYPYINKVEVCFSYHDGIETVIRLSNGETWLFKGRKL